MLRSITPKFTFHLRRSVPIPTTHHRLKSHWTLQGKDIHVHADHLTIKWPTKDHQPTLTSSIYHYTWLRDHCLCPQCIHPSTRQKLHASGHIPLDIRPVEVRLLEEDHTLRIEWNRPLLHQVAHNNAVTAASDIKHTSVYPLQWLLDHDYSNQERALNLRPKEDHKLWTRDSLPLNSLWMDYEDLMHRETSLYHFLTLLEQYGVAFVKNMPVEDHKQVEQLALRFGPIRETFYGRSWDVKSVPDAKNIAYTSLFLDLHMDLMYFEAPPGLQFLHCIENTVTGGESLFLDLHSALHTLRQKNPEAYTTLQRTPVTFHYRNNNHTMHFRRPTIATTPNDDLQTYFSPPFQGVLDCQANNVPAFYAAMQALDGVLNEAGLLVQVKLSRGACAVFANRRVLHGRTAFDVRSGHRHLRGTYVDLDVFRDRLLTLRAHHGGK